MALEEGFVARNTLDTDDIVRTDLDDLINHQEGIAVWEEFTNTVDIKDRCRIRIVERSLSFVELNILTDLSSHLIVDLMPWAISQDTTTDRTTDEREVTKHIEKLVARRLIGEDNRSIIDIPKGEIRTTCDLHKITYLVEVLLSHRLVIDDKRIVQVTTLDQIICEKHLYFTDEDERTARSDLLVEVSEVFK